MMVFISKVNNYMFWPKEAIFRLLQLQVYYYPFNYTQVVIQFFF
jgi:hypothetical protein